MRPLDLALAGVGQPDVLNVTFFQFSGSHTDSP
jgi:hypothetical protein